MNVAEITYLSEPVADYQRGLDEADDLEKLRAHLEDWSSFAVDALQAVPRNQSEFDEFRTGLSKERKGIYAGDSFAERYSAIHMPELMFLVSITANRFGVPWGCAFIRCREEGIIHESDGAFVWEAA